GDLIRILQPIHHDQRIRARERSPSRCECRVLFHRLLEAEEAAKVSLGISAMQVVVAFEEAAVRGACPVTDRLCFLPGFFSGRRIARMPATACAPTCCCARSISPAG